MDNTILNISAICDKAGRPINQDNFWVCHNLTSFIDTGKLSVINSEDEISLSKNGTLLVVADGMGGMSAGEVASQIVIDSIKKTFSRLNTVAISGSDSIKKFIKHAIIDSDKEIKKYATDNPETRGMGSTIVLLWILDKTVYVGWCGDSRAYCYNEKKGLLRLTHDHSYVQELVDNNKLSEEDAFDHPDSNIITRSLGDSGEKANPDVKEFPLHKGDIFLLCSDGLCGLLRDREIENIMSQNINSVGGCLNALWRQGSSIGWTDNATIELVKVVKGGIEHENITSCNETPTKHKKTAKYLVIVGVITFILGFIMGGIITKRTSLSNSTNDKLEIKELNNNDSINPIMKDYSISEPNVETHDDVLIDTDVELTTQPEEEQKTDTVHEIPAKQKNDFLTVIQSDNDTSI